MRAIITLAICLFLAAQTFAAEPIFQPDKTRAANPANAEKINEIARGANTAYKAGRWREAANGYRQITVLDPGNGLAWYFLGASLRSAGDDRGAMNAFQKALHTLEYNSEEYNLADRAYSELKTKGDKAAVSAAGASGQACASEFARACQTKVAKQRTMMESLGGAYNGPSAEDCAANASRNLVNSTSLHETPERVRILFGTLNDTPEAIECAVRAVANPTATQQAGRFEGARQSNDGNTISANPRVVLTTNAGTITAELYPQQAPKTVANFLQYVRDKYYDGTIFHRVIPGFMIQGGGYSPDMTEKTTRAPIPNESNNRLSNLTGTLAMARTAAPDSASSQFFINVADNPTLDFPKINGSGYAVFGKIVGGLDVVSKIAGVPTTVISGQSNVPSSPVVIRSIRIEAGGK